MEIERRERDPDTGEIFGEGFFEKIAAKLRGKTAKNTCNKSSRKTC